MARFFAGLQRGGPLLVPLPRDRPLHVPVDSAAEGRQEHSSGNQFDHRYLL